MDVRRVQEDMEAYRSQRMEAGASDDHLNELLAAGFLWGLLVMGSDGRAEAEPIVDDKGNVTGQILVRFPEFLKSEYRITMEIVPGTER
jgi:hypothetical protein